MTATITPDKLRIALDLLARYRASPSPWAAQSDPSRVFLSIVTRTQGRRNESLVEVLTCLAGQTCTDFEVIVIGHDVDAAQSAEIKATIADSPEWLRQKVRYGDVAGGGRARPLNVGLEEARGQYLVALDDDDLIMANYVEAFRELAQHHPGRVIRAGNVLQDVSKVRVLGNASVRAEGEFRIVFAKTFDYLEHLALNQSPNMTIAFPRAAFDEMHLRFNEELTTGEDWDFLVRVAALFDVASTGQITSIYRWWVGNESSRTMHQKEDWEDNERRTVIGFEESIFIMPRGTLTNIRKMVRRNIYLEAHTKNLTDERNTIVPALHAANIRIQELVRARQADGLRAQIAELLKSKSWKLTAPLRLGSVFSRRDRAIRLASLPEMNVVELTETLALLKRSRSWRISSPLRRFRT